MESDSGSSVESLTPSESSSSHSEITSPSDYLSDSDYSGGLYGGSDVDVDESSSYSSSGSSDSSSGEDQFGVPRRSQPAQRVVTACVTELEVGEAAKKGENKKKVTTLSPPVDPLPVLPIPDHVASEVDSLTPVPSTPSESAPRTPSSSEIGAVSLDQSEKSNEEDDAMIAQLRGEDVPIREAHVELDQQFDRYGFFQDHSQLQQVNEKERKRRAKAELKAINEWRKHIAHWNKLSKKPQKLKELIRAGVPDCFRGLVWQLTSGGMFYKSNAAGKFEELLKEESSCDEQITLDITRTFPSHSLFASEEGRLRLKNVLHAYSVYDTNVGYCQGMGFIAALLLQYMLEEDAFWCLVALFRRHNLHGMFTPEMTLVHESLYVLEKLVQQLLPRVYGNFRKKGVEPAMYAAQWFLTIFLYNPYPFDFVLRVWDSFLLEGLKVVFRIALAMLKLSARQLRKGEFEDILVYFNNFPVNLLHGDRVFTLAFSMDMQRKQMEKYAGEYRRKKAKEARKGLKGKERKRALKSFKKSEIDRVREHRKNRQDLVSTAKNQEKLIKKSKKGKARKNAI